MLLAHVDGGVQRLRVPTAEQPLRILVSGCLAGWQCGVNGTDYGLSAALRGLLALPTVQIVPFCPEDHALGTPRSMPDIHGGDGHDVLDGRARILDERGIDLTDKMLNGAQAMLERALAHGVELALLTDMSAACGSQVISDGCRMVAERRYQRGVGVATALLLRNGIPVLSQRDHRTLGRIRSLLEPSFEPERSAIDHHETRWYLGYFLHTPPRFLNDDGSASIATLVLMSHFGFRRDVARFARALDEIAKGDVALAEALKAEWQRYGQKLHRHHEAEDQGMFPGLCSQHGTLVPIIEQLTADHRRIDPLLEAGDRAFARLPETEDASKIVSQLAALLHEHLATEEAQLIPFLRAAKEFPPPATEEELALYAEGFAWSSHGIAADVLQQVDAMLPESLRARLPAARAAFDAQFVGVWGAPHPPTAHTATPER